MTQLIDAVRANDLVTVKRLLAEGADVEDMGLTGETPLVEAAARGHSPIVAVLLESGARVEDPRRVDSVLYLELRRLREPNVILFTPVSAIVAASLGGHVDTVELLEEYLPALPGGGERSSELRYARHAAARKSAAAH